MRKRASDAEAKACAASPAPLAHTAQATTAQPQSKLRGLMALSRAAAFATEGLSANITFGNGPRIGLMNFERLEIAPAGIVRGELIATIPLAPLEETAVVQKEWSVTSKEFTSIVTDSLENYSETGVTDNTELSQSTTSQNQHSNQFNITGTVSGGIDDIFDAKSTSGFTTQDTSSEFCDGKCEAFCTADSRKPHQDPRKNTRLPSQQPPSRVPRKQQRAR